MKTDFKIFDYVSFPTDKGSDEIREGFVSHIRKNQIDVVSIRKKEGNTFGEFGFHKKYLEKDRWGEVKLVEISKDIRSWRLYRVIAWAMVRFYQTYGEFKTDYIKPVTEEPIPSEAVKIESLIKVVRDMTIQVDRKTKRQV